MKKIVSLNAKELPSLWTVCAMKREFSIGQSLVYTRPLISICVRPIISWMEHSLIISKNLLSVLKVSQSRGSLMDFAN